MKKLRFTLLVMSLLLCAGFVSSCGDDEEEKTPSGTSIGSSVNLVGSSFTRKSENINDDGLLEEDNKKITFKSTSQCSIRSWGYDWIWDDGNKKNRYDDTKSCSYTVSGSKITLKNYPFYAFGGDLTLEYFGEYLTDGYDYYFKD